LSISPARAFKPWLIQTLENRENREKTGKKNLSGKHRENTGKNGPTLEK